MMSLKKRPEEIRKRIAKRKKERQQQVVRGHHANRRLNYLASEEEKHGVPPLTSYDDYPSKSTPFIRKELFMLQLLCSIAIFLVVGILFKEDFSKYQNVREFVQHSMEQEFQFAVVSKWYKDNFGQPLALLPIDSEETEKGSTHPQTEYAIPANGRILQSFDVNGQGIMLETIKDSQVEAIDGGLVSFAGNKENLGKTVIIQHADGSESWYGKLATIDVKLYDYIESRTKVGKVMQSENGKAGTYYFAIKKGDSFIDPIQVISFD